MAVKGIQGYEFVVEGSGEFPFDMLRYDRCWPATQDDIVPLAPHPRGTMYSEKRRVKLRGLNDPTEARWVSWQWKIVKYDRIAINIA